MAPTLYIGDLRDDIRQKSVSFGLSLTLDFCLPPYHREMDGTSDGGQVVKQQYLNQMRSQLY